MKEGGTWLASNSRNGRVGILLNGRDRTASASSISSDQKKISRGNLVPEYLQSKLCVDDFISELSLQSQKYDPFSLVMLEPKTDDSYQLNYFSNINSHLNIKPAVHENAAFGFGNSHPENPFLKVKHGLENFKTIMNSVTVNPTDDSEKAAKFVSDSLFSLLSSSDQHFPDDVLTNAFPVDFPEDYLCQLSCINVQAPEKNYGTRSQTLMFIDFQGDCIFFEKDVRPAHLLPPNFAENQITKIRFHIADSPT